MASKRELRALITLAGKIDPSLQTAMLKATGDTKKLSQRLKESSQNASKLGDMMKASFIGNLAANAVSNLTSKIREFASESIQLASDLIEVQNVVDVTFGTTGKQIDKWAENTLKQYGITQLQAKEWAGSMGAMLKSSGILQEDLVVMSTDLAGLAGDVASFYNLDHDMAWQKIRSGIAGQTEPLKQLGINMSVANLEAYALSKGIDVSYSNMNQASQMLLRYNYLLSVTTDAQGDFANTIDDYENQGRLFQSNLKEIAATLASELLPHFTALLQKANEYIDNVDMEAITERIANAFQMLSDGIKFASDNSNILLPLLGGFASAMTALMVIGKINGMINLWKASTFAQTLAQHGLNAALMANPIGLIVAAIGILVAVGLYLWKNWDDISTGIVNVWQNHVIPFFSGIGQWFGDLWTGTVDGFKFAWSGVTSWFTTLWDGITSIIKGYINIYIKIFNFLINGLNKVNFTVPDWVPGIGGKEVGINIPTLPMFARGGIATGPSIFGEAGPEMAIPLKRDSRSLGLLSQTAQLLGVYGKGNAATNIYISIDGSQSPRSTAEEVIRVVKEYFEDEGRFSFG